eukprot:554778-Karenia_brevis.AAC.1
MEALWRPGDPTNVGIQQSIIFGADSDIGTNAKRLYKKDHRVSSVVPNPRAQLGSGKSARQRADPKFRRGLLSGSPGGSRHT